MTDTWDGRPETPELNKYHWVYLPSGSLAAAFWNQMEWNLGHDYFRPCEAAFVWKYIGPCLTPTEVETREAAAYQRGQEDMRERAVQCITMVPISEDCSAAEAHGRMMQSSQSQHLISALPIKEAPHE